MLVIIKNLQFSCIIGLLDHERKFPQNIIVNLKIKTKSDKMQINYAEVMKFVKKIMKKNKFYTLEEALSEISKRLKQKFPPMLSLKISIFKPNILPNCIVGVKKKVKY